MCMYMNLLGSKPKERNSCNCKSVVNFLVFISPYNDPDVIDIYCVLYLDADTCKYPDRIGIVQAEFIQRDYAIKLSSKNELGTN